MGLHQLLATKTADATTGINIDTTKPDWARGAIVYVDLSASAGTTPLLDLKLQYQDPSGADFTDIPSCSIVQIAGTGNKVLSVYPGIAETANISVSDILPNLVRIVITTDRTTGNETYTYTVAVDWLG